MASILVSLLQRSSVWICFPEWIPYSRWTLTNTIKWDCHLWHSLFCTLYIWWRKHNCAHFFCNHIALLTHTEPRISKSANTFLFPQLLSPRLLPLCVVSSLLIPSFEENWTSECRSCGSQDTAHNDLYVSSSAPSNSAYFILEVWLTPSQPEKL